MNCFERLLVAFDFSEPSMKALDMALEMAARFDAHLTVVHTIIKVAKGVPLGGGSGYDVELFDRQRAEAREKIEQFLVEKNSQGVATNIVIESGRAEHQINRIADEEGADMLILGTHGRRGVDKLVLGSVAEKVLRDSRLPFLCIRT